MRLPDALTNDLYFRIIVAAKEGHGVQLSPAEVRKLSLDNAIWQAAASLCEDQGFHLDPHSFKVTPL